MIESASERERRWERARTRRACDRATFPSAGLDPSWITGRLVPERRPLRGQRDIVHRHRYFRIDRAASRASVAITTTKTLPDAKCQKHMCAAARDSFTFVEPRKTIPVISCENAGLPQPLIYLTISTSGVNLDVISYKISRNCRLCRTGCIDNPGFIDLRLTISCSFPVSHSHGCNVTVRILKRGLPVRLDQFETNNRALFFSIS